MAAFLIALVVLSAGALGEGTAGTFQEQNAAVSAVLAAKRPELRPNFVAGGVIVKLKDAPGSGITAQSEEEIRIVEGATQG